MRIARVLVALALFTSVLQCRDITGPSADIEGAVRFEPPPVYAEWWADTERCSGHTGDMRRISWYVVPDADVFVYGGTATNGLYDQASEEIVLAGRQASVAGTVRHEMLHALIRTSGHPREFFAEKCAGVVEL